MTIARYVALLRFEADIANIAGITADVPNDPNDTPILATCVQARQIAWYQVMTTCSVWPDSIRFFHQVSLFPESFRS